jgi:hypothetical protein
MADGLQIEGGGTIAVASAELYEHSAVHARLGAVAAELQAALGQVGRVVDPRTIASVDAPVSASAAERAMDEALARLGDVRTIAEGLPHVLEAAAVAYGIADRVGEGVVDGLFDFGSWIAGAALRLAFPAAVLGAISGTLTATTGIWLLTGGQNPIQWLKEHPEVYTNSFFTGLVGNVAEHADEALLGFLGLPVGLAPLMGGTPGVARLLTATHPLGAFRETPVRIERAIPLLPPQPPTSLTDAAERIKSMEFSGAQVVVEQYEMPNGSAVANVYVDGTIDWSIWPSGEPWDMGSNVGGVAQIDHVGAAEAVKLAMRESGIDAETPVQLFGYSQGGIQAALVAHQEEFNVVSLVTIGSPVGDIRIDPSIRALSVAHTEDLVFAFGDDQVNPQTVQVTTQRFADGAKMPQIAAPGHQFQPYVQTLERVDESGAPQLRGELERILGLTDGAVSSTSTAYVAERVQPD